MGTLYVVATPIGNLNDVSKRTLEVLENVDLIAAEDTRQTIKLLNHYDIKKKMVAYHKFNENNKSNSIIDDLLSDKDVALVSDAGTPCISDPGYKLVNLARKNGVNVIGIPGPSASVTALSISGLDTSSFSFLGFLPTDNKKLKDELEKIKNSEIRTFVIYESPKRLVKLIEKLKDCFRESNVLIASDLTKLHERCFFGSIEEVYDLIKDDPKIEKGEYVIILEKKDSEKKESLEIDLSIEALLIDKIIKENCNMKDAVRSLSDEVKSLKKNQIYEASLNLKKIMERICK